MGMRSDHPYYATTDALNELGREIAQSMVNARTPAIADKARAALEKWAQVNQLLGSIREDLKAIDAMTEDACE